jgi:di/tricarboxylate transporter
MILPDPSPAMWLTFVIIIAAVYLYATERFTLEYVSLGVIAVMLVLFYIMPVEGADGANLLRPARLLAGFADPALITVVCLLIVGQGLIQTGALQRIAGGMLLLTRGRTRIAIGLTLVFALSLSAFANNTPIVVVFIPVLQALADRQNRSTSKVMIPLSYAAILGGMTTLIGSSTNLLVSGGLRELGEQPFDMFSFTVPGLVMAGVGLLYTIVIAPRLLTPRTGMATSLVGPSGRQYIAQITLAPSSSLVGQHATAGMFTGLPEITVQVVQRGEHAELPPFDNVALAPGDTLVVAGTRNALADALSRDHGLMADVDRRDTDGQDEQWGRTPGGERMLVEVMIAPASRMVGQNLEQIGFRRRFGSLVLGIQRRSRMIRQRITEIRLEPGDVLLVQGRRDDVEKLRANPDVLLMEWSAAELPNVPLARRAIAIVAILVLAIATNVLPAVIAAVVGAAAMLSVGCLNVRQATRAVDIKVVMLVGAALAMGSALQVTGGADYLGSLVVAATGHAGPAVALSVFFLMIALLTNVLSNNAAAVLFTPVGVSMAHGLGVDPMAFAVAVVMAASCSFASPIGYQTNLLVMAPGHYRFSDFIKAGLPLLIILWLTYSFFAPVYYGLG